MPEPQLVLQPGVCRLLLTDDNNNETLTSQLSGNGAALGVD